MILVTGGAGYIGSHTCVELLNAGLDVTVFDNFCNSRPEALARVQRITGRKARVVQGDIRDAAALARALRSSGANAVIHFAGLKAVGESAAQPLAYYDNNVNGTLRLLEAMVECNVKTLVFSSSATVYGDPQALPLTEDHKIQPQDFAGVSGFEFACSPPGMFRTMVARVALPRAAVPLPIEPLTDWALTTVTLPAANKNKNIPNTLTHDFFISLT